MAIYIFVSPGFPPASRLRRSNPSGGVRWMDAPVTTRTFLSICDDGIGEAVDRLAVLTSRRASPLPSIRSLKTSTSGRVGSRSGKSERRRRRRRRWMAQNEGVEMMFDLFVLLASFASRYEANVEAQLHLFFQVGVHFFASLSH